MKENATTCKIPPRIAARSNPWPPSREDLLLYLSGINETSNAQAKLIAGQKDIELRIPMCMPARVHKVDIEWSLLVKVGLAAIVVWAWLILWPFAMAVILSVFVAVTLEPYAAYLERKKLPHALASALPVVLLAGVIAGFVAIGWTSIQEQFRLVVPSLGKLEHDIRQSLPILDQLLGKGEVAGPSFIQRYGIELGRSALKALVLFVIGLILTVYLLVERHQTMDWVVSFMPRTHRQKGRNTLSEAKHIIVSYVTGNVVTAMFAGVFVFTSMTLLGVQAPLLLALLAAVCDFVPILGFLVSATPAILLASRSSGGEAVIVIGLYFAYHFLETYIIAPWIYGNRLKLSNVAVVMAFAIGAELGGVIGAVLALPIAATYPAIERIWLGKFLGDDVVEDHQRRRLDKAS